MEIYKKSANVRWKMNDRFRYRVWEKTQNKWLHFDFSTYPTYQDRICQALTDGETFYQCTGLKDKNGKLIYEGDIVKTIYNRPDGVIINRICVIEYNRSAFWINYGIAASYLYNDDCIYEVIGNRYENKDLLNEVLTYTKQN